MGSRHPTNYSQLASNLVTNVGRLGSVVMASGRTSMSLLNVESIDRDESWSPESWSPIALALPPLGTPACRKRRSELAARYFLLILPYSYEKSVRNTGTRKGD